MPSFTYTINIPIGNQTPAAQRPSLEVNTNSINLWNNVDHYTFGSANSTDGYHQKSTYIDQVSDQASVAGANVVYGKTSNALVELFMRRPGQSAIQLTDGAAGVGASVSFGQSFLAGGFQIKWGTESLPTAGGTPIAYTSGSRGLSNFPNNTIAVFVTPQGSDATQTSVDGSLSSSGFTIYSTKNNLTVSWLAIGY